MRGCGSDYRPGDSPITEPSFIVDSNVGKLAKLLRLMGYDTVFFDGIDDSHMVARAVAEGRVILTRDTGIMKRRLVTSGRLKALLINSEEPEQQVKQVIEALKLKNRPKPFTICLECNRPLIEKARDKAKSLVPPHVFRTQDQYMECPACHRIYWKGTHWEAMNRKLEKLRDPAENNTGH